jgi:hypothetical protein
MSPVSWRGSKEAVWLEQRERGGQREEDGSREGLLSAFADTLTALDPRPGGSGWATGTNFLLSAWLAF